MKSFLKQIFSDETGWGSFSRITLAYVIPFSLVVVGLDIQTALVVNEEIYKFLTIVIVALISSSARYELQGALTGLGTIIGGLRGSRSDTPSQSVIVGPTPPTVREGE